MKHVNFRELNSISAKDRYRVQIIDQQIDKLGGYKQASGYYQVSSYFIYNVFFNNSNIKDLEIWMALMLDIVNSWCQYNRLIFYIQKTSAICFYNKKFVLDQQRNLGKQYSVWSYFGMPQQ